MAYKVNSAFSGGRTIDEAIAALAAYDPKPASPMWDGKHDVFYAHLPRWRDEAAAAHDWLLKYKNERFP